MRITAISDIHGDLIKIDPTDLFIIAGDWSPLEIQTRIWYMREWIKDCMIPWFESIPADKIVFIAGNHDFICDPDFINNFSFMDLSLSTLSFEKDYLRPLLRKHKLINKVKYLCNNATVYKGYKIFGYPYVDGCKGWAFSQAEIRQPFKFIRKSDIFITHQPPLYKNIGKVNIKGTEYNFGSKDLLNVIEQKKPEYLFCGHIHEGDHTKIRYLHSNNSYTNMYNCAIKNEDYQIHYNPCFLEIPDKV